MSDQDKFAALGRAHAALKNAKSNEARLRAALREYDEALRAASFSFGRFVDDPAKFFAEGTPLFADETQRAKIPDCLQQLATDQAILQIAELREETGRVRQIQEEIDQF